MSADKAASIEPTRVRYRVLAFVCGLSMITYLDRVCFGTAAPEIAEELGLSGSADLKWAFTAFSIAYGIFEIPTGWLGDRLGPRGVLIRIVAWWSICTALTGVVGMRLGGVVLGGLGTLIVLRFLFGAGEAGAYPNITRALHNWFPMQQWEFAQGTVWMSGRLMGGLTPLIWAKLVADDSSTGSVLSWRGAFLLFGAIGLAWCAAFAVWFRNRPQDHPDANEAELALVASELRAETTHAGVPWRALATNRSLIALCIMYALITYAWVFNITYLPDYLQKRYGVSRSDEIAALYIGAPLWIGAAGCFLGGFVVDGLARRLGDRRRARRALGMSAMTVCAASWVGAAMAPNMHVFCLLLSLSAFSIDLTLGSCWATCQDLGRRHAAVTAACMNMIGTFGAAIAGWLTGTIVQYSIDARAAGLQVLANDLPQPERLTAELAGYDMVFWSNVGAFVIAAICWRLIDPRHGLEEASAT